MNGDQIKIRKGFPSGSTVKNLPAIQEMQVQSLGQEEPLEKEMATQYSQATPVFLLGKSYGQWSLVGYIQSMESQKNWT